MGELQPGQPNTSVLGKDIHTEELVTIDQEQRVTGLYIIGKTGTGKITLKVNLILQDIEQGMGVVSSHRMVTRLLIFSSGCPAVKKM